MRALTRRSVLAPLLAGLIAPLALVTLAAAPANAIPDCDVPNPPPICDGGVDPHPDPAPAPRTRGDFDGDGRADLTVFREYNGSWYTIGSKTGQPLPTVWFGNVALESLAAPGHYDVTLDRRWDHESGADEPLRIDAASLDVP